MAALAAMTFWFLVARITLCPSCSFLERLYARFHFAILTFSSICFSVDRSGHKNLSGSGFAKSPPAKKATTKKTVVSTPPRKPLFVVGRVSTSAGKPLSGAEISIYGTTARGDRTHFETTTAANGLFSQRVPDGIYGVGAQLKTKFNGKNYIFNLHPEDGKTGVTHDAAQGIVKKFRWKISGLKPGEAAGTPETHTEGRKYHGGYVSVSIQEKGFGGIVYFPKGATIVIDMTPRGKLIDGSVGRVKTFRRTFDADVTSR